MYRNPFIDSSLFKDGSPIQMIDSLSLDVFGSNFTFKIAFIPKLGLASGDQTAVWVGQLQQDRSKSGGFVSTVVSVGFQRSLAHTAAIDQTVEVLLWNSIVSLQRNS